MISVKLKSIIAGSAPACRSMAAARCEIGGHRLLDEHRLAASQRRNGDLGLHPRRRGNGDCVDIGAFDHLGPVAEGLGDIRLARQLGGARLVGAGKRHDLAARIEAEGRQLDRSSIIAAHDAQADHGSLLDVRRCGGNLVGMGTRVK